VWADELGDLALASNNVHRRPQKYISELSGRPRTARARELPSELDPGSLEGPSRSGSLAVSTSPRPLPNSVAVSASPRPLRLSAHFSHRLILPRQTRFWADARTLGAAIPEPFLRFLVGIADTLEPVPRIVVRLASDSGTDWSRSSFVRTARAEGDLETAVATSWSWLAGPQPPAECKIVPFPPHYGVGEGLPFRPRQRHDPHPAPANRGLFRSRIARYASLGGTGSFEPDRPGQGRSHDGDRSHADTVLVFRARPPASVLCRHAAYL
jgi:hypothetical protein